MTLFPQKRKLDPHGDVQAPLQWKKRSVMADDGEKVFWYAELNENDWIKLTKLNPKRKPLYNGGLCQFEFCATFKVKS